MQYICECNYKELRQDIYVFLSGIISLKYAIIMLYQQIKVDF